MRSNVKLQRFAELGQKGLRPNWAPGSYVGRGFADLGHEEFYVLPGERLLSLATGAITQVPSGEASFFYWLPSPDEMVNSLLERGWGVSSLEYVELRQWRLTLFEVESASMCPAMLIEVGDSIEQVLICALSKVVERS